MRRDDGFLPLSAADVLKHERWQSREAYRALADNAPDSIDRLDRHFRHLYINAAGAALVGRTPAEVVGRTNRELGVPDAVATIWEDRIRSVFESGSRLDVEDQFPTTDGTRYFETRCVPEFASDGSVEAVLTVSRDTTLRRQAQEGLRVAHEQLATIVASAPGIVCDYRQRRDGSMFFAFGGERIAQTYGIPWAHLNEDATPWLNLAHPDDRDALLASIAESGRELTPWRCQWRVMRPDGEERWIDARATPRVEADGSLAWYGVATDVSDSKRGELALKNSEQEFHRLAEAMPEIVWATTPAGLNTYVNARWTAYTGMTAEETHGAGWAVPFHPDDQPRAWAAWQHATATGSPYEVECRLKRADGEYEWFLTRGVPVLAETGAILKWFGTSTNIDDLKQTEAALRTIQGRLTDAQAVAKIGSWETSIDDLSSAWSDELFHIFEVNPADTPASHGAFLARVHPADRALVDAAFVSSFEDDGPTTVEHRILTPTGTVKVVEERWRIVRNEKGAAVRAVGTCQDITERKQAEEDRVALNARFQQAQKLESVGRLAGGVAHDFNNMLGVILGNVDLALTRVDQSQPIYEDLSEVQSAAVRSAELTRQLLAFARKDASVPRVIDLDEAVASMLAILKRLIGEDIDLQWHPGGHGWNVYIDPSQVDQILANLCVNARDAIDGSGTLRISTTCVELDEACCSPHPDAAVGAFVRLAVTDSGCGMDADTLSHVFEPFFTTKGPGQGTGLGLATVYGIVRQHHGFITIDSTPGVGSTFNIHLPRHVEARGPSTAAVAAPTQRGSETILVVEDDPQVLKMTTRLLHDLSYTVLAAGSPAEALRIATEQGDSIHLLITDVVMPGMNGRQLADRLLTMCPHLRHLFTSGYTTDVITHRGLVDEGRHFLRKPFTRDALAAKVREVLSEG